MKAHKEGYEIHCTKCGSKAVTMNGKHCIRLDKTVCNGKIYHVKKKVNKTHCDCCSKNNKEREQVDETMKKLVAEPGRHYREDIYKKFIANRKDA